MWLTPSPVLRDGMLCAHYRRAMSSRVAMFVTNQSNCTSSAFFKNGASKWFQMWKAKHTEQLVRFSCAKENATRILMPLYGAKEGAVSGAGAFVVFGWPLLIIWPRTHTWRATCPLDDTQKKQAQGFLKWTTVKAIRTLSPQSQCKYLMCILFPLHQRRSKAKFRHADRLWMTVQLFIVQLNQHLPFSLSSDLTLYICFHSPRGCDSLLSPNEQVPTT